MASYLPLGPRYLTAAADTTGLNAGNLTNAFTEAVLSIKLAYVEAYHISITGVPAGAVAQIVWNTKTWGFTAPGLAGSAASGAGSEVDYPSGGLILAPGDEVDFLWSVSSSMTPKPTVTLWLRYDSTLPANQQAS
jgi:hypothetical protein